MLGPLVLSAAARVMDQVLAVVMLAFAGFHIATLAASGASGSAVWWVIAILVLISAIKAVLRYAEQFFGHYVAFQALELIRTHVFASLGPQSPAIMRLGWSGDLLSRITRDIDRIEVFFAHTFAPAVSAVIIPAAVTIWGALVGGWPIAVTLTGLYLVGVVLTPLVGAKGAAGAATEALSLRGELLQHVTDTVQGVSEVVGYGREAERLTAMRNIDNAIATKTRVRAYATAFRTALSQCALLGGIVLLGTVGASQLFSGELSLAWLVALLAGYYRSWASVRAVEDFAIALDNSFAAAGRIFTLEETGLVLKDGKEQLPLGPLDLAWHDVTFSYPGRAGARPAVHNVSATAPAGQWTCLVGATGSGKSTLANLAMRYFDPDSGSVTLGGRPLTDLPVAALRDVIAVVTQRAHIFRGTIRDNLLIAKEDASDEELWQALTRADLADFVRGQVGGLDAKVGERGTAISGGQRQRLTLARAFLREARVLILDEFSAHVDPTQAKVLREHIRAVFPVATVIEITHRLTHLDSVDHVIVIDNCEVVEAGTPADLLDARGALWQLRKRG
ncbi:MAG: ATP-binding cassette domain-containing protein [Bowdeniella nasicola]|nr:ATP-binding cassette domain-containing protein [Bowdeniella nasicola]